MQFLSVYPPIKICANDFTEKFRFLLCKSNRRCRISFSEKKKKKNKTVNKKIKKTIKNMMAN
ncbi:MAG: hypothetical protein KDA84_23765, partial [Planctomycetaceae bacterium]|nr:hypothetical protein [Planctomycetaceae bacterium]